MHKSNIKTANTQIKITKYRLDLRKERRRRRNCSAKNAFLNLSIEARHGVLADLRRSLFFSLKNYSNLR